ncbi:hypothetical protein FLLO111716_09415 [Flavobacterium longum]|uniref:DUF7619 domain-containing protein n=1 Tax=Flavobacterium longum TaxID=1299340 RepID=UPI0039E89831
MKKLLSILLLASGLMSAQIVTIPDANFKTVLLSANATNNIAQGATIDANADGEIQVSEAAAIVFLDVQGASIADLTGIQSFTGLELLFCGNNLLTTIDVSGMPALKVLVADHNQITSINVASLVNLESIELSNNQLTSLALNGQGLSSLRGVSVGNNQLTSINVSGISTLENYSFPNNQMTTLNLSGLANLKSLDCSGNQLTSLAINNLLNMELLSCYGNALTSLTFSGAMLNFNSINCSQNQLTSLNVGNLTNLVELRVNNNTLTTLNTTGLTSLKTLDCNVNNFSAINVTGLTALEFFSIDQNELPSLTIDGLPNLKSISLMENQLTTLNLSNLPALTQLNCGKNLLTSADFTNLPSLEYLFCEQNALASLTVAGMPNLQRLFCHLNDLTSLNLSNLPNLQILWCDDNQLTTLDLSDLPLLTQLQCSNNILNTLDLAPVTNLEYLYCPNNQLTALDLTGLNALQLLWCSQNALTALDISGMTTLRELHCDNNSIPVLNTTGLVNLERLFCRNNQIPVLDLNGLTKLVQLDCAGNLLTTLDASTCTDLVLSIDCGNNQLQTLFVKNGAYESVAFYDNPDLLYICGDEVQIGDLQIAAITNNPATVVSSYCSFTPGGDVNKITGMIRFDENNDGCNAVDVPGYDVRFNLTGPEQSGTFANVLGEYTLYTLVGDYTLNASLENPSYFNLSPTTASFNFPVLDNSVQTQDFCLTANGAHPDLEIVIMPFGVARPGFDADYMVVYKNKGNQTLSGTVNVVFDADLTDFVSATPTADNISTSALLWNFADLHPFETRTIYFTLNVNTPLETPAVDSGDVLDFTASINFASGDDTPQDNVFGLKQTVVNSFDPNAKTCLEGDVVSPERIGQYLHYNIEFENLGTGEAINVVVKDIIDTSKFDISTLQVLQSSHPMRASIKDNVVEFYFENINLAPAAGDPPVGGHGNVLFKIKTLETLTVGDEVENKADIYFDYNAPILTDVARTSFQLLSNPDVATDTSIIVYPNPVRDIVNLSCATTIQTVEVYDVGGRLLRTAIVNAGLGSLDLSQQASGIYFLKVTSDTGQYIGKVVKK